MKVIRLRIIHILCLTMIFSNIVLATSFEPPATPGKYYVRSLQIIDPTINQPLNYMPGAEFRWYAPMCVSMITEDSTATSVEVAYTIEVYTVGTGWQRVGEHSTTINLGEEPWGNYNLDLGDNTVFTLIIGRSISDNNALKNLSLDKGELMPRFNAETIEYTATVAGDVDEITVYAEPESDKAEVERKTVVPLVIGKNTMIIMVTAENGTKREYTINITRQVDAGSPKIIQDLSNETVVYELGEVAKPLQVLVEKHENELLTYSWYSNTVNSTTGGALLLEWNSTYTPKTTQAALTYYYCVVTSEIPDNGDGGIKTATTTSSIAKVRVTDSGSSNTSSQTSTSNTKTPKTTANEKINRLSEERLQKLRKNLGEYMPYTALDCQKTLLKVLKQQLADVFTLGEIEAIVQDKALQVKLGVSSPKVIILTPKLEADFWDVKPTHWAYEYIKEATSLGLVNGFPDGAFKPSELLGVADTFTFLDRLLLLEDITELRLARSTVEKYVTDKKHWAFSSKGSIGSKLSETTLSTVFELGDGSLSRGLLAQVLYEVVRGKLEPEGDGGYFVDIEESPYKEAIIYCEKVGLLKGIDGTHMAPQKTITRAELMTILIRLKDKLNEVHI